MDETQEIQLKRYIVIFIATYVGFAIVLAIVRYFFESSSLIGVKFVLPMLSGMMVRDTFLTRKNRIPTKPERNKLMLFGFLGIVLFELGAAILSIWAGVLEDISLSLPALAFLGLFGLAAMFLVNYFLLLKVFGSSAEKRLKIIQKKKGDIGDVFD